MAVYQGEYTKEISFPLGGIGSGSIGLAGSGRLIDWEIFNRPNKGSDNGHTHIALKAEDENGLVDARVLCGDIYHGFTGQYGKNYGHGLPNSTMAGFPHFEQCVFDGEFPAAKLTFRDKNFPGKAALTAFNPFIPLNDRDSSIPAAFFEIGLENDTDRELTYTAAFSLRNPFAESYNLYEEKGGAHQICFLQKKFTGEQTGYGDLCLAVKKDGYETFFQQYWYRGGWSDSLETYWRNFTEQSRLKNRIYDSPGSGDTATLAVKSKVPAGKKMTVRFVLSWNIPNCCNYWSPYKKKNEDGSEGGNVTWKNYYATLFANSAESAGYAVENWDRLFEETKRFRDELFASALPKIVTEAISATMSVLKTATVLRLEDGSFWGFEGLNEHSGCCEGTCAHVWNYAYALPFLFPKLERSIRDNDYKYNIDENGRMQFRMQLPLGRPAGTWRACVDGQMGGVIKTWREWKISGDDEFLKRNWPSVKASLEYAWNVNNQDRWDADRDGVLEGRQHHTLDMELFGPSSWLEGFYLAALKAGAEMASWLGDTQSAGEYRRLFDQGRRWSDTHLFNGKYYMQKIDLTDKSILENAGGDALNYWNDEIGQIKYQIGEGCEIDQLCAQWHANVCGLGDIFDKENRKTALRYLYQYNFKPTQRESYNPFRIYALNDEPGAVICDYPPEAVKPGIPISYCQESMHGFEYQLAALMISEGMIDEGVGIVKSIRGRYDGRKRNPWNEIECGSNYARSMASYSMIPIFSGFTFDMPRKTIGFNPITNADSFRCIWSLDRCWGNIITEGDTVKINILSGELTVNRIVLPFLDGPVAVSADGEAADAVFADGVVTFKNEQTVIGSLVIAKA